MIAAEPIAGITETVPTYRSLLVHYDPLRSASMRSASSCWRGPPRRRRPRPERGAGAFPSPMAASTASISRMWRRRSTPRPTRSCARHVAGDYRVAMIGFTPGWSYLSGLDKFLHLPRRKEPRLLTPAGTISIGGIQTGVQCLAGPERLAPARPHRREDLPAASRSDLPAGAGRRHHLLWRSTPRPSPNRTAPPRPASSSPNW